MVMMLLVARECKHWKGQAQGTGGEVAGGEKYPLRPLQQLKRQRVQLSNRHLPDCSQRWLVKVQVQAQGLRVAQGQGLQAAVLLLVRM